MIFGMPPLIDGLAAFILGGGNFQNRKVILPPPLDATWGFEMQWNGYQSVQDGVS